MNRGNRPFRTNLGPCPKCGMDSGRRMVTDTPIELYLVKCESCGYQTKPLGTQGGATRAWNQGTKKD